MSLWLDTRTDDHGREPVEELRRQNRQFRALCVLADVLIADSPLPAIYEAAITALTEAIESDRASVLRFDSAGVMRFRAWRGLSDAYRAATDGHSPWSPDSRDPKPVLVPDAEVEPGFSDALRRVVLDEGIRALAFIPIVYQGRLLGKFMLYFDRPHQFSPDEVMISRTIAGHIAVALGRTQGAEDLAASRDRLALLQRVSTALSGAVSQRDVADVILTHGVSAVGGTGGGVACITDDGDALTIVRSVGQAPTEPAAERDLSLAANTPLATAARTGQPVWMESAEAWRDFDSETARLVLRAGAASWAALPLLAEGRVLGSLGLAFSAPRSFDEDEQALMLALADQCAQSLWRARLYEAEREAHRQAQEAIRVRDELLVREQLARADAELAIRQRDEFLSVASHELRTPLTSLQARAQLSARRLSRGLAPDSEQVSAAFEEIRRQAERLGALITQLLDVSRLQAGQLTLERARIDIGVLTRQVVRSLPATADHGIDLRAPEALLVMADGLRLEQVLTNLLDNAIKYSPDGGAIEADVRQADDAFVEIAVRDHGLGIPPERRSAIFERFYRAHTDSYQSGLGLGLYISRQIVELHGGTIRVEFPDDGGTRFVIRLPLNAPAGDGDGSTG